jgi:hypothetical protein
MSYKLNQKDPERRKRILAKRAAYKGKGIDLNTLKLDRYGDYILPNSGIARGKQQPSPMKQSRRNAMMRRLGLRVAAGDIELEEAKGLIKPIMAGAMSQADVYGDKTNRQLRALAQQRAEAEKLDAD